MQDKNPGQRQGTQSNPRREEAQRQGIGTSVRDEEGWHGEAGRHEEAGREERSRGFYANALRRLRERSYGRGGYRPSFDDRRTGYGGTGYGAGYDEPEFGRGSYGQESRERWGGQGQEDWRTQQGQSFGGFPQGRYGQGWTEEPSGGYGDVSWDRNARQQDWRPRDREVGQRQDWQRQQGMTGQHQDWQRQQGMTGQQHDWQRQQGMYGRQAGFTYGQQDWQRQQDPQRQPTMYGEEDPRREARPARGSEAERSRWGGWAAPFFGGSQQRRTHWRREPYTVRDVMTKDPECVTPQSTLRDIARLMKDENVGVLPVVDENRKLKGIITDRDLVVRALAEDRQATQVRIDEIMTHDVEAITEDEEIHEVLDLMGRKQVRRLPVVDEQDRLIGVVSISDIAQKADYDEELQEALEKISSRRSFWSRLWT